MRGLGRTPLYWTCIYGHVACARLLVAEGADIDKADKYGWTALDHASGGGHTAIADLLRSWILLSPLMKAVVLCQPEQVRTLLHSG